MGPSATTAGADIARHHAAADPGPPPLVRAVLGLGVGAAAGVLAALLTPRPERARRQAALAPMRRQHRGSVPQLLLRARARAVDAGR